MIIIVRQIACVQCVLKEKVVYIIRKSGVLDVFNLWSQAQKKVVKLKAGICDVRAPSRHVN